MYYGYSYYLDSPLRLGYSWPVLPPYPTRTSVESGCESHFIYNTFWQVILHLLGSCLQLTCRIFTVLSCAASPEVQEVEDALLTICITNIAYCVTTLLLSFRTPPQLTLYECAVLAFHFTLYTNHKSQRSCRHLPHIIHAGLRLLHHYFVCQDEGIPLHGIHRCHRPMLLCPLHIPSHYDHSSLLRFGGSLQLWARCIHIFCSSLNAHISYHRPHHKHVFHCFWYCFYHRPPNLLSW